MTHSGKWRTRIRGSRLIAAVLILLFAMSVAGWAGPQGEGSSEAVTPITVYMVGDTGFDPENDLSILEFEKRLNVDLDVVNGPWGEDVSKLNLMMASAEYPDIMHISSPTGNPWMQWVDEGLLVNFDDYITRAEHPFIHSLINSATFKSRAYAGGNYTVAGTHHGGDWNFRIRKDWLDKLGLDMPTTPDELYDVFVAFRDGDPDGNGKADTVGLVAGGGGTDLEPFKPIFMAFNGTYGLGDMDVENGKVVPLIVGDGTLNTLKYVNRLYRERLLNTDFINYTDSSDAKARWLMSNKGGSEWLSAGSVFPEQVAKIGAPGAEFASPHPPINDPGTKFNGGGFAHWLMLAVSSESDYIEKSIEVIEYANSREGRELFVMGIEGRHWSNFNDGLYDLDLDQWSQDYDVNAVGKSWPRWWGWFSTVHGYIPAAEYDTFEEAMANIEIWANSIDEPGGGTFRFAVADSTDTIVPNVFDLVSIPEANDMAPAFDEVRQPIWAKILIADDPAEIDGLWEEYLNEMNAEGFQKFVKIYQDYYDQNLK
jgi:putative aldouronate transport system substrate-binding protein